MQDWVGGATSIYATHGASNHSEDERADMDYYATDPEAVEKLLNVETFNHYILEPACGGCHISKVLSSRGHDVKSYDIVDRGDDMQNGVWDFLAEVPTGCRNDRDIITNPPYKFAKEFVEHALDISMESVKVAMLMKLTFLEGVKRKELFEKYPPRTVYVFRSRIDCWKNGEQPDKSLKAVCYAWFVWVNGYKGETIVKWLD